MEIHNSVTIEKITDAVERSMVGTDNPGFCVKCGTETEGVEPDTRGYRCDACGERAVYGAEELLYHMVA